MLVVSIQHGYSAVSIIPCITRGLYPRASGKIFGIRPLRSVADPLLWVDYGILCLRECPNVQIKQENPLKLLDASADMEATRGAVDFNSLQQSTRLST